MVHPTLKRDIPQPRHISRVSANAGWSTRSARVELFLWAVFMQISLVESWAQWGL
jgi:hypothetical protein